MFNIQKILVSNDSRHSSPTVLARLNNQLFFLALLPHRSYTRQVFKYIPNRYTHIHFRSRLHLTTYYQEVEASTREALTRNPLIVSCGCFFSYYRYYKTLWSTIVLPH